MKSCRNTNDGILCHFEGHTPRLRLSLRVDSDVVIHTSRIHREVVHCVYAALSPKIELIVRFLCMYQDATARICLGSGGERPLSPSLVC